MGKPGSPVPLGLECDDLSSLWEATCRRRISEALRFADQQKDCKAGRDWNILCPAERGTGWATSRPAEESGDWSPHSKAGRQKNHPLRAWEHPKNRRGILADASLVFK